MERQYPSIDYGFSSLATRRAPDESFRDELNIIRQQPPKHVSNVRAVCQELLTGYTRGANIDAHITPQRLREVCRKHSVRVHKIRQILGLHHQVQRNIQTQKKLSA